MEEIVGRVFNGGKVTVPKQLRERFNVEDGDYVRLVLVEVLKKSEDGEWVRKRYSRRVTFVLGFSRFFGGVPPRVYSNVFGNVDW